MSKFCKAILSFCLCALVFNVLVKSFPLENEVERQNESINGLFTQEIPSSVTKFCMGLMQALVREKPEENVLLSPVSAYAALMLLHLGAGEKTRKELNNVLKISSDKEIDYEKLHEAFSDILKKVEHNVSNAEDLETIIANGFFVQKDRPINDSFLQSLRKYYNANVTNVNFLEHAGEATDAINSFISGMTKNRIEKFYETALPSTTVSVLSSALYFNGVWQNAFSKEHTEVGKFKTGTSEVEVPMMRNQKVVSHSYSDVLQFETIELPYKGGEYSMHVILPRPSQTVKNLTEHIHLYDPQEIHRNTRVVGVDYKVPKMKFSWKSSLVNALGLEEVFRSADLSRMSAEKVPISDMLQATEIEVNEQGTVATTATAISNTRLLTPPVKTEVKFYVDQPFVVSILHKPTHMVLFQGVVYKPQK